MKSLLAVSASIIFLILIAFPEGLQAGTIYDCRDQNGSIVLSDTPLGKGYNCKPVQAFKDITDDDRQSWEKERNLSNEQWDKYQAQEEKDKIEKRKKEVEVVKEQRAEETLRAAQGTKAAATASAAQETTQAAESRPIIINKTPMK